MDSVTAVEMTEEQKQALNAATEQAHLDGGGEIKTLSQLHEGWGIERYVPALGTITGWLLDHRHPHSREQLLDLVVQSQDALSVYLCLMRHGINS